MLMHSTPKTNCTPHAVGDPLIRPLTIARQVMIAQNTQAAPKAWKKCWNSVTTLTTVAVSALPSTFGRVRRCRRRVARERDGEAGPGTHIGHRQELREAREDARQDQRYPWHPRPMPVVVMVAVRLRPRPQGPGEKEEAAASCEVAERGQKDGNPVADRRREVDQTLHDRDCRNAGF